MATPARSTPRSLAEDLRARGDGELEALLAARPDLASPLPGSTTALATRATTRASVQRALDALDTPALQVAEVLAVLPSPTSATAVARTWGARANGVLAQLRERALLWGPDRRLHLVHAVRDLLGPHPAGLGPPLADALGRRSPQRLAELLEDLGLPVTHDPEAALGRLAAHLGDAAVLEPLLGDAPEGVRALLEKLTWGPPTGSVERADRQVRAAGATGPVDWLLAHGLLAVSGPGTVVLPREVGLALRGGRVHRSPDREPPAPRVQQRRPEQVTAAAAEAAAEACRLVEELGLLWGSAPPPVLRAGGVGVRELRRTAAALEVDEATAALVAEVAHLAGLVADDAEVEPRWLPTPAFDAWREEDVPTRWLDLARPWLGSTRVPALVGTRDVKDALRNALGPDLDRGAALAVRRSVLAQLAAAGEGGAVAADDLAARLRWDAPRRAGRLREELVRSALRDAGWLGVVGAGALAPAGRALLDGDEDAAAAALALALPAPVTEVLLQADLTAVAPGPLESHLAQRLAALARVESRGGATVYRFDAATVRHGLDEGLTADDALRFLADVSATGVPQPLEYLVRDVARRHGRVRVGRAGSYVRAEDPAVLAELLTDRRCARLGLRPLAPTVLAAQAEPEEVLAALRAVGLAPAAEGPGGELLVHRPPVLRSGPRTPPRPVTGEPPPPSPALLTAAVRSLRTGDEDAEAGQRRRAEHADAPALDHLDPSTSLVLLRQAAAERRAAWIGYADADGAPRRHLVEPIEVAGGRITALDRADGAVRTFSVHRVTGVAVRDA
ncbi:helicase-associated domain-containing protein [Paenibacillus sp. TRM 82003]|uniref:helicase-associated domain-containing protein n=1 Tax=Kineococcus sp. TRM81007 TaxID=2925831 RepID=UPI001F589C2E|nr:helicase-associated domain-containing protein [Kineococcus sp. TRM81007]MCI2239930.1 helicase-associated domain-containing protein [Kineococcus sp. TRM81007]MCI3925765.1 helicase-associated domain-containing protein [Paenibacillus sp. TRM 82003]